MNPFDATLWKNRGNALSRWHKYEDALKSYNAALKIDPNYRKAHSGKADALYQAGRYEDLQREYPYFEPED
jgi:tetratricopeptide (TPR) repeat protein